MIDVQEACRFEGEVLRKKATQRTIFKKGGYALTVEANGVLLDREILDGYFLTPLQQIELVFWEWDKTQYNRIDSEILNWDLPEWREFHTLSEYIIHCATRILNSWGLS